MTLLRVLTCVLFSLGTLGLLYVWIENYVVERRARIAEAARFDVAAARRESHELGLPFPEADGRLSLPSPPRPTAEQVHEALHARRLAAQPDVMWTVGTQGTALYHVDACSCPDVVGPSGPGKLLTDSRCKALAQRAILGVQ